MNPINTISDILEHALEGHEKVTIFETSVTAKETVKVIRPFESNLYFNSENQEWLSLVVLYSISISASYLVYLGQLLKKSTKQARR